MLLFGEGAEELQAAAQEREKIVHVALDLAAKTWRMAVLGTKSARQRPREPRIADPCIG